MPARVIVPLVTVSVTCTGLAPASTSLIEICLPLPRRTPARCLRWWSAPPGRVFTGASLTRIDRDGHRVGVRLRAAGAGVALIVGDDAAGWPHRCSWQVGAKLRPFRAVLMLASVPVKVMVASAVPSPVVKVSPAVPARVSVPLVPVSVTCTGLAPASTSRDRDLIAVARGEHQRRVFVDGLRRRHRVDRRIVDRVDRDGHRVGVDQRSAGAGVALVVGHDLQGGGAVEVGGRREAQPVERRVDVGHRAGEGHGGVGRAVAGR